MLSAEGEEIMNKETLKERFRQKRCCVIIPTYNNHLTLAHVIDSVSAFTSDIVVVNDGSTDSTTEILRTYKSQFSYHVVHHQVNKGKGVALQTGFKYAFEQGYLYAITIDSDGQHMADDLPKFLDKLEDNPAAIIMGARNMEQASVPKKSSFGNNVSNFWFKFETGINLPDTQSGYRLYPIYLLQNMRWFTRKYEFEIEVMVRAAWRGINIIAVPVSVYYAPRETRITHFRPFKDSFRVGVLNSVLVVIAVLYIKPLQILQKIRKTGFKNFLKTHFLNAEESNKAKALSVALGIFMGIVPLWGFQMLIGIFLASLLKLNKVIVLTTANISIPPMIPFILYFSYLTGGNVMGNPSNKVNLSRDLSWKLFKNNPLNDLLQYYVGGTVLALLAGIGAGILAYLLLAIFRKKPEVMTLPSNA